MDRNAWVELPVTIRVRATGKTRAAADENAHKAAEVVAHRVVAVMERDGVRVLLGMPKTHRP